MRPTIIKIAVQHAKYPAAPLFSKQHAINPRRDRSLPLHEVLGDSFWVSFLALCWATECNSGWVLVSHGRVADPSANASCNLVNVFALELMQLFIVPRNQ